MNETIAAVKAGGGTTLIVQPSPFIYRLRGRLSLGNQIRHLDVVRLSDCGEKKGALTWTYGPISIIRCIARLLSILTPIIKGHENPPIYPLEQPIKV